MVAKIRIQAGAIEFEYEGETAFTIEDIKDLFSHIESMVPAFAQSTPAGAARPTESTLGESVALGLPTTKSKSLHIDTIASKLAVSKGPELIVACIAYVQISLGRDTVARKDILETMKKASKYNKESYKKNLTASLNSLVGRRINKISDDKYSLTADEFTRIETLLNE